MIFLRDNVLLDSELTFDHIKPRLLGKSRLSSITTIIIITIIIILNVDRRV